MKKAILLVSIASALFSGVANALVIRASYVTVTCSAELKYGSSAYLTINVRGKPVITEQYGYDEDSVNALQAYCDGVVTTAASYSDKSSPFTPYILINTEGKLSDGTMLTNEPKPKSPCQ